MSSDTPCRDNTDGQNDGTEPNPDVAVKLARRGMSQALAPPEDGIGGDVAQLAEAAGRISHRLAHGEDANKVQIRQARVAVNKVREDLDDLADLYGINKWDIGATWGELTEEEREEVHERRLEWEEEHHD